MAKKGKAGRTSLFTPEVRSTIIRAIRSGTSAVDACNMAGIGNSTLYDWLNIGQAHIEGRAHDRMPEALADREVYAEFAREYKTALAQGRLSRVMQITRAGQENWRHIKTGVIRYTAPPPITWLNTETGDIVFEDPTRLDPSQAEHWQRQFSGEAWAYHSGEWQAAAWYLERSSPDDWALRSFVRFEHGVKVEDINRLIDALNGAGIQPTEAIEEMIRQVHAHRSDTG